MTGSRVPPLIVAEASEPFSEITDPRAPEVEVCLDAQGEVLGYCRIVDGQPRMHVPNLAAFHYERDLGRVRAVLHRPLSRELVVEAYQRCVLPLMLPALGTEVLHASAVVGAAGVAALCGVSGTGKSTIAVALARRGHGLWADDAVALETTGPEPIAIPLPFKVRLRRDSAEFLSVSRHQARPPAATVHTQSTPLTVICVLRQTLNASDTVVVERLGAAAACQAALAHAYCFTVKDPARKRQTIQNYLSLAGRVPAYEVRFGRGLERLRAVLDAIEEIIGRGSTDSK